MSGAQLPFSSTGMLRKLKTDSGPLLAWYRAQNPFSHLPSPLPLTFSTRGEERSISARHNAYEDEHTNSTVIPKAEAIEQGKLGGAKDQVKEPKKRMEMKKGLARCVTVTLVGRD